MKQTYFSPNPLWTNSVKLVCDNRKLADNQKHVKYQYIGPSLKGHPKERTASLERPQTWEQVLVNTLDAPSLTQGNVFHKDRIIWRKGCSS